MSNFIVHSIPGSPYGRTVLAALEEKGARYRLLACRGRVVTEESQRQADYSITLLQPLPPDCAVCGERPEFILEIVRPYVGGTS